MTKLQGLGAFDGKAHVLPISVYYEDTDLSGVVYHANYLRYMERGRTEFFRLAGISKMAGLDEEEPTAWAIRSAHVEYHRPARLDGRQPDDLDGHGDAERRPGAGFLDHTGLADRELSIPGQLQRRR